MAHKSARQSLLFVVLLTSWTHWVAAYDVLELPAVPSELAVKSLLHTVVKYGDRYFATGHRGHIIYSDDAGATWTQAGVPVRSGILDIHFPTPEKGWATGHDGVILHSSDGGKTWVKQYDGYQYGKEGLAFYKKLLATDPENETYQILVEELEFAAQQGADRPFFKVLFHNDELGHVLGAYGMVLVTRDAGKTWTPRMETVPNFGFNHLYDVTSLGNGLFFYGGERGVVLEADLNKQLSVARSTPWEGSFFTCITATDGSVVMGGLRGNAYRSEDAGRTWDKVDKPASSTLVDSILLSDGRLLFAGQGGDVLLSSDNGRSFSKQSLKGVKSINSVAEGGGGKLLIAGPNGIKTVSLKQ